MNSQDIATYIGQHSDGRLFSVTFIKKDGTERKLVGRLGVTKGLVGGRRTLDPETYLIVWDVQNGGYRAVNRGTIIRARVRGQVLEVDEEALLVA